MEEPVPNIVFVKAKKKRERKSLQPTIQVLVSLVTAIVAISGILLSYQTFLLNAEERAVQRKAASNNRFTYAIEHLKNESLAIRMGALFELKKLGLEDEALQENIARILGPFIREGIENEDLLFRTKGRKAEPNDDTVIACEIVSLFGEQIEYTLPLVNLQAEWMLFEGVHMQRADLSGANLENAVFRSVHLQDSDFSSANLKETSFDYSNLKGAKFFGNAEGVSFYCSNLEGASFICNLKNAFFLNANLEGAGFRGNVEGADFTNANLRGASFLLCDGLTVEQLLEAFIDDTTSFGFDGHIAKDPRIQARIGDYAQLKGRHDDLSAEYGMTYPALAATPAP
ncbi:MAG: pentapeptide repeat-containing protein [Oscillospiraceae bacterium]|jgi:uncharacterized protein YjbI with pentapeptide repeats|nr:pentapeptide repeat-containing protein [Oscillospiraceae bacterium]